MQSSFRRHLRRLQTPLFDLVTSATDPVSVHRVIVRLTYGLTIAIVLFAVAASLLGTRTLPIWLIFGLGMAELAFSQFERRTLHENLLPAWMPPAHMVLSLVLLTVGLMYSGGVQSAFVWAFGLSMAIEGILRGRRWALASASLSAGFLLATTVLVRGAIVPAPAPLWAESTTLAFLISYIGMFFTIALMASALGDRLRRQNDKLAGLAARLRDSYLGTIRALVEAVEAKDVYTAGHSDRVETRAVALAKMFGLSGDEVEQVRFAAILHDVGKIGVPDAILGKPGPLSFEERLVMREHAGAGASIVGQVPFLTEAARIVRHHHEWFEGTGYPDRLARDAIPIGSRIIAVVDSYEAMTSDRPYREALAHADAVEQLRKGAGRQYDPRVVEAFLMLLGDRLGAPVGVPGRAGDDSRPLRPSPSPAVH